MKKAVDRWAFVSSFFPKTETGDFLFSWLKFIRVHGRMPSRNPTLFNDVLFKIKSTHEIADPLRVFLTDKEYFKLFVAAIVGENYTVETEAVLRSKADVDSYTFPDGFCAKPTHMSGEVLIVKRGESFDKDRIKRWFDLDHYAISRERNYRLLRPKVIIEKIIFGESDITDFRIFCVGGKAKVFCIDVGKYSNYRRAFYSIDWQKLDFSLGHPLYEGEIERPENLSEMIEIAEKLARQLNFVRVDFYSNGKQCFLGEMTNCHASASQQFIPIDAEYRFSEMLFDDGRVFS